MIRYALQSRGLFDDDTFVYDDTSHNRQIMRNISGFWEANSESESSDNEDGGGGEGEGGGGGEGGGTIHKISFQELRQKLQKQYNTNLVHKYSTTLDVFARYIQCHHMLYSEASHCCSFRLNAFMLPCIFLSTSCAVLSSVYDDAILLFAIINGVITFLLAIISFLKLDARAESHKISAYQLSKLKSQIEFSSGELLLYDNEPFLNNANYVNEQLEEWKKTHVGSCDEKQKELLSIQKEKEAKFMRNIEKTIVEIKEALKNIEDNNHFELPVHILRKYKTIYQMNVFLYMKSIDTYKNILLNDLRNVKNETRFYGTFFKDSSSTIQDNMKSKYVKLYNQKNQLLREYFELNKGYSLIDAMLQQEIINIELRSTYWFWRSPQDHPSYKPCTHIGCVDEQGSYLLEKVLHC